MLIAVPSLFVTHFATSVRGELGSRFPLLHNYCSLRAWPSCMSYVENDSMIAHIGLRMLK